VLVDGSIIAMAAAAKSPNRPVIYSASSAHSSCSIFEAVERPGSYAIPQLGRTEVIEIKIDRIGLRKVWHGRGNISSETCN
jgi:hypothetical protein